jgi:excisionase family DNA binding protein
MLASIARDAPVSASLISVPEMAHELGVSPAMIFKLLRSGELTCIKIGRRTLFEKSEPSRFSASRRVKR